jgi:opacity protein-like surface antigen
MKSFLLTALSVVALAAAAPAWAQEEVAAPRMMIEIYKIAPGQHEAFLKEIARYDEANRLAGVPPRQLYVHSDGADWDFILIQPNEYPADKQAALDKAWKQLGLPSGADFFLNYRRFIADHSDTVAIGPTSAAAYLATRSSK